MRNLKKFLALVLAMLMVVSAGATVSAYSDVADEDAYAAAIAALTEWGIVNGTELGEAEDGSDALYEPDADVTRWQMALMMARTLAPEVEEEDWAEGMEIFGDVTEWYGAIAYAYVEGIINGVSTEELVFKPNDGIKYQDGLIMALRALGYDVDVSGVVYWLDAWTQAKQIGLTDGIAITSGAKTMTRAEMAQLIYNMINLPFADGSYSLAIKYYGEAAPEVEATVDTFVITATPKQAYVKGQHIDETQPEGYEYETLIGIQKLEAGIPAGDIFYIPAADAGIEAADVENYFHYAVNLYNYDAETGYYDAAAVITDGVKVLRNHDGFVADGSTIKVDGYTYYTVASFTDAALRNEIVVFSGEADKKASLVLLKNKDGDIVNFDGEVVATFAYTLGSTNYYVAQEVDTATGEPRAKVISETTALNRFGVETEDNAVFTEYVTLTVDKDLDEDEHKGTSYQLTFFDDDADGKYERAIYNTVYMTVYNSGNDGKDTKGLNQDKHNNMIWTDSSVRSNGTVFTYTYNNQASYKKVTVLDKIGTVEGVLTNVDLSKNNSDNNYTITLTIGGKNYKVARDTHDYLMGADMKTTTSDNITFDNVAEKKLNYNYNDAEELYKIGSTYKFYEYNGYLIQAKDVTPNEDKDWTYFVSNGAVSYDSTALYVDGYIKGEKVSIEIAYIDKDTGLVDKDTAIADMNIFDLGEFLADAKDDFAKGNLYKVVKKGDDTYKLLSYKYKGTSSSMNAEKKITWDAFKLWAALDTEYVFKDGNSVIADTKESRLRTNANTVFYFIRYTADGGEIDDLDIFTGEEVDDGWFIKQDGNGVYVFADQLGFGDVDDKNGVANSVFVYYTKRDFDAKAINGFGITTGVDDDTVVYVATPSATASHYIVTGADVDGSSAIYHKYTNTPAMNMHSGATIGTIYSEAAITAPGFYTIDEHNVVTPIAAADLTDYLQIEKIDNDDTDFSDEYLTITGVAESDKITSIKATNEASGKIDDIKTKLSDVKGVIKESGSTESINYAYYLVDGIRNDNLLVVVVLSSAKEINKTEEPTDANATFTWTNAGATKSDDYYATVSGISDGDLSEFKFTVWTHADTSKAENGFASKIGDTVTVVVNQTKHSDGSAVAAITKTGDLVANDDGSFTVTITKKLPAGTVISDIAKLTAKADVEITITLASTDGASRVIVVDPFAYNG